MKELFGIVKQYRHTNHCNELITYVGMNHKGSPPYKLNSYSRGYENRKWYHLNLFSGKLFWSVKFTLSSDCNLENSAVATGLEKVSFHYNFKER